MTGNIEDPAPTYRVVVVCPAPRHEFTVTVDPVDTEETDPVEQACEIVFALLNIGGAGFDDLPELGYGEQAAAVRAWYAHHRDLPPGARLEVITPDGIVRRLACDAVGYAHPEDAPVSKASG